MLKRTIIVSALLHTLVLCLAAFSFLKADNGGMPRNAIYVELEGGAGSSRAGDKKGKGAGDEPDAPASRPQDTPFAKPDSAAEGPIEAHPYIPVMDAHSASEKPSLAVETPAVKPSGNGSGSDAASEAASTVSQASGAASHSGGTGLAIGGDGGDYRGSGGIDPALMAKIRDAIGRAISYPELARRRGLEGTVIARFYMNEMGMPEEVTILKSSGHGILDKEVKNIIKRAAPYPTNKARVEVPVVFRLKD